MQHHTKKTLELWQSQDLNSNPSTPSRDFMLPLARETRPPGLAWLTCLLSHKPALHPPARATYRGHYILRRSLCGDGLQMKAESSEAPGQTPQGGLAPGLAARTGTGDTSPGLRPNPAGPKLEWQGTDNKAGP